jgi:MFS family permease
MVQTTMDTLHTDTTQIVLYLSYFYKHHELTLRLSWFWGMMTVAEILAALLAYGILHMRDVEGRSGWRWLFLIEVRSLMKEYCPVSLTNNYI